VLFSVIFNQEVIMRKRKRSPSEADFLIKWSVFAPAYPLVDDDLSLRLPFANSGRRFKADFCHVGTRVCIEIQGGVWSGGKHGRGAGIKTDAIKLAIAQRNGWQLFQVVPGSEHQMMPMILGAIIDRGGKPERVRAVASGVVVAAGNPF
jgi:hypothetical protein